VTGAIRLIHPFPVAVVVLTSGALLELAHHGGLGPAVLIRGCSTVLMSQIAVGACNDYVDRFDDARVQPDKPIPSGAATAGTAVWLITLGLVGLVPFALSFGPWSFLLIGAGTAFGLAYDLVLKRTPLSLLGYIGGFLLLVTWIWEVAGQLTPGFWVVYPAGALIVVSAHLAQSLPDIETDREVGGNGLAVALGVRGSVAAILACCIVLTVGTASIAVYAGAPVLVVGPISAFMVVLSALLRLRAAQYARPARIAAFKTIAPCFALIAVAAVVGLIRLHIL
jgi:4-hydroxybenzoate polyprenyltransferase